MRLLSAFLILACLIAAGCSPSASAPETKELKGNRIPPGAGPGATRR